MGKRQAELGSLDISSYLFNLRYVLFRYHVPRSWLKPTQNLLVVFEELGGDVSKISLVRRSVTRVCADTSEHHPTIENFSTEGHGEPKMLHQAKVHLRCAAGESISTIKFASFGTPSGTCESFQKGTCHAPNSLEVVKKAHPQLQSLFFFCNICDLVVVL